MKKRLLSIIAILTLCLALLSVTALAEDAITVNDVDATDTAAVTEAFGEGKVSYDVDTNTLTINGTLSGPTVIQGNGTTDVVINGVDNSSAANGLTVNGAKDVTVTANSGSPAIGGATVINCSGDVNITNNGRGMAVPSSLTITGAQDVEVTANSDSAAIGSATVISCTGNVSITNNGTGQAVAGRLTVNGVDDQPAQNVTVSANSSNPAISGHTAITCSGNVTITNEGAHAVSGALTVNGAQNVTVTANSGGSAINGANINCSGDVKITNIGNGLAVAGTLTVNDAQNVTVTANSGGPTVNGATEISCSGNVSITNDSGQAVQGMLTVDGAQDVTVTANSYSPALPNGANINCSGDVEITNQGTNDTVNGSLYVAGAQNVTVTANSYNAAISTSATIACSGNVEITNTNQNGWYAVRDLTVTGAQNVTVTANNSRTAISGNTNTGVGANITCSGDVSITNSGSGTAVDGTLTFQQSNGHSYTVKTGNDLESLDVYAEKEAGEPFGPESFEATVSAVKIESAGHTPGEWEYNSTRHWRFCTVCEAELDRADHTFSGNTCTVCGYTKPVCVPTYPPIVEQSEGGTVTVSPKYPTAGSKVTITPKPDEGYVVDEITVTDKNGNPVEVTDNGDGTYSFTQPADKVNVKVTFVEDNTMLNFFVDVPADAYYYDAVLWAAENGITGGTSDTTFSPNAPCTRAQIVTFLWRAAGSPEPESLSSLSDVPADAYYAKAVAWALENGITTGTGNGTFSPNATCTRAQAMTFIYRSVQAQGGGMQGAWMFQNPFEDVDLESYYGEAVMWAVANGVTKGTTDTAFSPDANCTRVQIVTFLYRSMK
ncbi:MAG: S-layer homology domain-containing protein [Candidatus Avoscillospira sp.]